MTVGSVGSNTQVYTPVRAQSAAKPQQAPKGPKDADGDNDGTTAAQAAAYKSGSVLDVEG